MPRSILGAAWVVLALTGCGQRGPLFIPTDPAAANRATLPQALRQTLPGRDATAPDSTALPQAPLPVVPADPTQP